MPNNRDDFIQKTKDRLAKRVGYRCSNPNCRKLTCGAAENPEDYVNIGVAAHIRAASPGGKRYDNKMTASQRKSILNGIWLCQTCAKLIDSDELRYTVDVLHKWKYDAETESAKELENQKAGVFTGVDALHVSAALNQEINELLAMMENIHQKLEAARQDENVLMTQAYEKRLESLTMLYTSMESQLREMVSGKTITRRCACEAHAAPAPRASRGQGVKVAAGLAAGAVVGALGMANPGVLGGLAALAGSVALGWGISGLFREKQKPSSINSKVELNPEIRNDREISYMQTMRAAVEGLAWEVEKLNMDRIEYERILVEASRMSVQEK